MPDVPSVLPDTTRALAVRVIPIDALPSQVLAVQLGEQPCRIDIYQRTTGLFLDLYVADRAIVTGVVCRDRAIMVIDAYRGFVGDLTFYDTQGTADPQYDGLGTRWQLLWVS